MPHATHKARRIDTSGVPHAPVRRPRSRFQQQALLTGAVGFTMVVIIGLYAASFKTRDLMRISDVDYPRWTVFNEDILERMKPMKDNLADVKQTLSRMAEAGTTQAKAAAILKAKIEARASSSDPSPAASAKGGASAKEEAASGTPETPETP